MDNDILALSGLLADVLKLAMHDWHAPARASVSICLAVSGLSHLVATKTVDRDEFTRAAGAVSRRLPEEARAKGGWSAAYSTSAAAL